MSRGASQAEAQQSLRFRRHITDFAYFAEAFTNWNGSFTQMSAGAFRGELAVYAGASLRAFSAKSEQAILTRGDPDGASATIIPIGPRTEANRWRGRYLERGNLLVKGSDVPFFNQTPRGGGVAALVVPVTALHRATRALLADDPGIDWSGWSALRPEPLQLCRLERAMGALLPPAGDARPLVAGSEAEAECIRRLIDAVVSARPSSPGRTRSDRGRLVSRVHEHMRDRLDQPLSAIDLCEAFGVSDRLLRLAFQEVHGMGPLAYLRILRLNAARLALLESRGRNASVARVLAQCGVTRPAAFAGEYRRHFGELPSETLGVRGWAGVQAMTRDARRRRQYSRPVGSYW